jgi:hypothetical protein
VRIAITGRNGQVAQSLLEVAAASGIGISAIARSVADLLGPGHCGEFYCREAK